MSNYNLIARDNVSKTNLENKLAKISFFKDTDQFITMYNANVLDRKTDMVKEILSEMEDTYINFSIVSGKIVLKTEEQVACENIKALADKWSMLVVLKRFANQLLEENYPVDTKIVFLKDKQAVPQVEIVKADGETSVILHWLSEKIATKNDELANNILLRSFIKTYNNDSDSCYFLLQDLVDLETDFLIDVEKIFLGKIVTPSEDELEDNGVE